jgi:hypothetical protein
MVISSSDGFRHRLGWMSHHLLSAIGSRIVTPALRSGFTSHYQLPEYTVLASVGLVIAAVGAWSSMPRWIIWYRHPPVLVALSAISITVATAWVVHSLVVSPRGFVDLSVYRLGVAAWWQHGDLYGDLPPTGVGLALPFTYPPFAVLVLGPLALPPWRWSIGGLTALSVVALILVIYLTIRAAWSQGGRRGALVGTAVMLPLSLFTEPVADTIWFGQVNLLLMALVVVDCLGWPSGLSLGNRRARSPSDSVRLDGLARTSSALGLIAPRQFPSLAGSILADSPARTRIRLDNPAPTNVGADSSALTNIGADSPASINVGVDSLASINVGGDSSALTNIADSSASISVGADSPALAEIRAECLAQNKIGLSHRGAPRFQSSPFWVGVGRLGARLWMVGLLWMERRRARGDSGIWPRGLLIGIAVAIKLTPAVFLLFFLLRKDYRAAVTMTVTALVATLVGFFADWSGSLTFWFGSAGGAHAVGNTDALVNQSLAGGLARAGLPQTTLWLVLVLILLVFVVVGVRKVASAPLAMVITAGFGLIASPISWGHHWVYVVPAIIVLAANGITRRQVGWLFAAVALVAVYRVAAFLDVGGTEWAPVRLLAENSYVVTGVALLLIYAGPDVCRLLLSRPALRSWRSTATRRVAALPPPPPCPVADASRSPR